MNVLHPTLQSSPRNTFLNAGNLLGLAIGSLTIAVLAFWIRATLEVKSLMHSPRLAVSIPSAMGSITAPEPVSFLTTDGLTIRGWFVASRNGAIIILCHGHGQNRMQLFPEADLLVNAGFGVLMFDWRAHGESDGELSTRGDRERFDLLAALDYLSEHHSDKPQKFGALGFSRGGSVVVQVAAADRRIQALVVQAAATSLEEALIADVSGPAVLSRWPALWAARLFGIDIAGLRPVDRIADLSPRPVFIMHGTDDPWIRTTVAERLFAAADNPKQLWLVKGAGHGGFMEVAGEEYRARIVKFFETALLDRRITASTQP